MQRILIVDDNDAVRESLRDALACEGYLVEAVSTGAQAVAYVRRSPPDVVLLDVRMPDLSADEIAASLCRASVPFILLTADRAASRHAVRLNAVAFVTKPFDLGHLLNMIDGVLSPGPRVASIR